jgi:hypothetical protein
MPPGAPGRPLVVGGGRAVGHTGMSGAHSARARDDEEVIGMLATVRALLLGVLLVVTLGVLVPAAGASPAAPPAPLAAAPAAAHGPLVAQPPGDSGPTIDPAETAQADQQKSKNKLIVGGVAALLLVLVYFGRKSRNKRRRKSADAAKGK